MKRRDFMRLGVAAGAAVAAPAAAEERKRLVGILLALPIEDRLGVVGERIARIKRDLARFGWVEGQNIRFAYRSTFGGPQARAQAVADIVALEPDVIATSSSVDTATVLAVTRSIPVVFATAADPVGSGFADTLARPGRNVTGFTNSHLSMGTKWLQFLKEMDPRIRRVGILLNPAALPRDGRYFTEPLEQAASAYDVVAKTVAVRDPSEVDTIIARYADEEAGALILPPDPFTVAHRERVIAAAARHRVPAMYSLRYFPEAGGLISYGAELDIRSGQYINLILRGARPGDLPIQSPRKYELLINRKAADALGLAIPLTLLARADEIIQ
jgi:putative ABC transport system substrate-binding protein